MVTILSILFGVSVAINLLFLFFIRNLFIQNTTYEAWSSNVELRIQSTYDKMKEIDNKEMFEKDDDVGVIFSEMYNLITDLNEIKGGNEENASEEKSENE